MTTFKTMLTRSSARAGASGRLLASVLLLAVPLAGCSEGGVLSGLRPARIASQPDEFLVLPTQPLELPSDLSALPPPAPGTTARVAYRPQAEAISALTGQPVAASAPGGALVAQVQPADPAIRATLAAEDQAFRERNRPLLLNRVFRRGDTGAAYESVTLDAEAEWLRLRALGVRVPAAPGLEN